MKRHTATGLDPDSWVDDYGDALFGFALARVGRRDVAEDLVQETYMAALRSRAGFKGLSAEKTWLFGILKHKILDHYGRSRKTLYLEDISPRPDGVDRVLKTQGCPTRHVADSGGDPEQVYTYLEFLDYLYRCLANLPRRSADVFISREIDGLTTEEICHALGITKFNCWTRLHRAKNLLRKDLAGCGFKPSA